MYIIYVNHDSVIKQICQLRDKTFLINETVIILLIPLKLMQEDTPGKHKNGVHNWKWPFYIGMILVSLI